MIKLFDVNTRDNVWVAENRIIEIKPSRVYGASAWVRWEGGEASVSEDPELILKQMDLDGRNSK
jgi:hypothetical protein